MCNRLAGKVALITGAAVGIGRATAELFAREGAAVAAFDRDPRGAQECAEGIVAAGGKAIAVPGDVTLLADAQRAVAECEAELGGLDIVMNNAGVLGGGTVESTEEDEWHRVIGINLTGVYLVSKAAIPALRRRGGGSIINVSSAAGLVGWFDQAAYDASKGGVVNLTRSMALDFAKDGIRANCLVPAHVVTPMSDAVLAGSPEGRARRQRMIDLQPIGRFGEPIEIAYGALFLASDESKYMTGSPMIMDGGYLAR
jgi:NAD(P)-dependent dehydrogenase (short-subunit alcohol dehydrogenase family)